MQLLVKNFSIQSPYRKQQTFGAAKLPFKPFKVVDEAVYEEFAKQKIKSGFQVMSYAAKWANLMEHKMQKLQKGNFADIARTSSAKADQYKINYGIQREAVEILCKHWVHGEELRKVYPA